MNTSARGEKSAIKWGGGEEADDQGDPRIRITEGKHRGVGNRNIPLSAKVKFLKTPKEYIIIIIIIIIKVQHTWDTKPNLYR